MADALSSDEIDAQAGATPPPQGGGADVMSSDDIDKGYHFAPSSATSASGYVAAGGKSTWGDVLAASEAGVRGAGADIASDFASHAYDPKAAQRWQAIAENQRSVREQDVQAMTPAGQQAREGSFFSHPLIVGAEAAPGIAAVAVPSVAAGLVGGPAAGALVAGGLMAEQTRGQTVGEITDMVMNAPEETLRQDPTYAARADGGMTPIDNRRLYATEHSQQAGQQAEALGFATGVVSPFAEAGGFGVGKIAASPLIQVALSGIEGGTAMSVQSAGQTAITGTAESQAGLRGPVTGSEILESGWEGFKFGAPAGALAGVSGHPTRSLREGFKPEARGNTGKGPSAAPAKELPVGTISVPSSPITPDIKAATDGKPITQGSKPQEVPVQSPPGVAQPGPSPAQTATETPQTADTTAPPPPPQPPPKPQPAPAAAAPAAPGSDAAPRPPADPAVVAQQHAELVDPNHSRDAMIVPKGVQVPDIIENKGKYGSVKLPGDSGTVVYDHNYGRGQWNKDTVKAAAKDGTLTDKIEAQAAKPAPQSVVGAEPAAAVEEPAKAPAAAEAASSMGDRFAQVREEMKARQAELDAAERGEFKQPQDVQPEGVQPTGASQEREEPVTQESKPSPPADEKLGENKFGMSVWRKADGSFVKRYADGRPEEGITPTVADLLTKQGAWKPAEASETDKIREAAQAEAARQAPPERRILRVETPEEARAAAAQTEAQDRAAATEAAKPATRVTKEPEAQQPGNMGESKKEVMRASNAVADDVVRNNLPQAGDEHAPDPARGSDGKGARVQVKARVEKMVKEAVEGKFQFMKMLKDRKDPELAHSASAILLHEAKRLADLKVAKTSDYRRFLDRERELLKGEAAKADVLKERRAAGKEFAAAAGKGVKEVATEGVETGETQGIEHVEKPDVAEEYEKAKERVEEEKVTQEPGEERKETPLQKQAREASERARAKLAEQEKGPRERVTRESEEEEEPAVKGYAMRTTGFKVEARKGRFQRQEGEAPLEKVKLTDHEGKDIDVLPSRTTDAETMLQGFKTKSYGDLGGAVGRLRDTLVHLAGDTPVHYLSDAEMTRIVGRSSFGAYDNVDDVILINRDYASQDTPPHEVFHAATSKVIRKNPDLRNQMDKLRTEMLKSDVGKANAKRYAYYFGNSEEFLTALMTHPEFQNLLKGVRISDALAKEIGIPKWRKSTMWEGMLGIIRKALNLGPRDTSAIEAAMAISENAMWRDPRGAGLLMEATGRLARHQMDRFLRNAPEEPEREGRAYGRDVKEWTGKLHDAVKTTLNDKKPTFKKAAEQFASEPMMADIHRDLFKVGTNDPLRSRLDAMQKRGGRAEELSQPGLKLSHEWTRLAEQHGLAETSKAQAVMRLMNEFKVYGHDALGEGSNTHLDKDNLSTKQARAVHPEVEAKWNALHPEFQQHLLDEDNHFKAELNGIREVNARNFIEGLDPPAGSTVDDVVKRMLDGKLTDADTEYYKRLGVEGLDVDVFQKHKGPYFPPGRFGEYVVRAKHDVLTPKGSDRDYHGNLLEDNVRRFDTEPELDKFLAEVNLHAVPSRKYYFDNPAGGRIYQVPDEDGNLRNVTHDEAGIGYGSPKHEFWAVVQHKRNEFSKTLTGGEDIVRRLKEGGLKDVTGVEHYRGQGVDKSFTSPQVQTLLSNIDKRRDLSENQKAAMKDAIRETAIVAQSGNRLTKNFVRSQKVQGGEYGGEALANYSLSAARYRAAAEFQPKIDRAFEDMRQVMSDNPDDKYTTDRSRVYNDLAARSYNATPEHMYPQYSPMVQKITQAAFIQDMASVSHLLTHQLNLHYMGASVLGPRHGIGTVFKKFYNIMREAGGPWMAVKKGFGMAYAKFRDPEADYTSMLDMMRNSVTDARRRSAIDEMIASQHIHRDSGVDALSFNRERGAMDKVSRFIRDVSGSMDSMGRFVTGLSAYDMEYAKNGGDHDAALLYAKQTIEKGLIHYGAGMRAPALSGPMMRVMSQFRLPGMNMLYLLGRNAYLAFRSADMATRHEAWWGLGTMLLGGWALSGSSALPTEPLKVMEILGSQLGITPTPSEASSRFRMMLANEFGPTLANAAMDGPLSMLGSAAPSFAHRVASPELSFGEPKSDKPEDFMSWLAQFTFGATGSLGVNTMRGSQALMQGDYANAFKYLAPKQLADAVRAAQVYGGQEDQQGPLTQQPQGPAAVLEQLFGVRSQTTVRRQEGRSAFYQQQQADKTSKAAVVKAVAHGDGAAMYKWNHANPDNLITPAEIRQARTARPVKGKALEYENVYQ